MLKMLHIQNIKKPKSEYCYEKKITHLFRIQKVILQLFHNQCII